MQRKTNQADGTSGKEEQTEPSQLNGSERARDEQREEGGPRYGGEAWQVADERGDNEGRSRGASSLDDQEAREREHHGEVLQRHVMHQLVVAALQEGRIDGDDGFQALAGESCRKCHGVLFGDADIEIAVGKLLLELNQP